MITAADLHGIMAMMPAFTTDDGGDVRSVDTVDVDRLEHGVNRMLADGGADVITTTGSFGELSTLLPNELDTLARATVETVAKRVPVIVGCAGLHTREVIGRVRIAADAGADGVIVAVPFYFPSTVDNAVQFFEDVAALYPKLGILIYHNPVFHRITLPVEAFEAISRIPNVVGMKDSHRTTIQFQRLMDIVQGRMSVFVNHSQYNVYHGLGARGFWSIDGWMGPEPMVYLRRAVSSGDTEGARAVTIDSSFNRAGKPDLAWREVAHKLAVRFAGYCDPGPLRPPFIHVPEAVIEHEKARAARWRQLCEKYSERVVA